MNIFIAMSTIIQQLHTAIQAKRDNLVEYIITQINKTENPVFILDDPIIKEYISVCNNYNTINMVLAKNSTMETKIEILTKQCSVGNSEVVNELTRDNYIDVHYQNELFFRTACKNGHLETARMLTYRGTNIHALDNDAFRQACKHNHPRVAQWLYTICQKKYDLATLTECYNIAKQNNSEYIVDWLLSIYKPVEISVYDKFNMDILAIENNISPPNIISRQKIIRTNIFSVPAFAQLSLYTLITSLMFHCCVICFTIWLKYQ
jgi:hypothetical protein